MIVLKVLEYALLIYLMVYGLYVFISALAGRLKRTPKRYSSEDRYRICVLMPAYKEDAVIYNTALDALSQTYTKDKYDVVVVADSLQPATLQKLRTLPIKVVEVFFDKSTKAKALNWAFDELADNYDIAVILDADNVMEPDFLRKIAAEFEQGEVAVQACRTAKNLNTSFAVLDAASERVNNHLFRRGYNALGLSSSFIGSGAAFDYKLIKETLSINKAIGGFDKFLQLDLIRTGHFIKYQPHALVYDEKVDNASNFQNQRRRWVSSQFKNLKLTFAEGIKQLGKGNFDYFNLSVISNLMLPRILLLGIVVICFLAVVLFSSWSAAGIGLWATCLMLYVLAILFALGSFLVDSRFLIALATAPKVFFIMFLILFRLKNADSRFIHTPHNHTQIQH
jgi:cellulose synthase/poly-beta-1,6-N-acetylglucosamine synthase-like glycosyltransferase